MNNLVIGSIFDEKYEIESVLGAGGIGTVYKAREFELNREVAIKVLNIWSGSEEQLGSFQRFRREARVLSQLHHPGILQVYKFGVDEVPYLVTEYVKGESLREILERDGKLSYGQALQLAVKLAEALAHAHANGVVHRDLKPENLLLDLTANPIVLKLIDFGLCKPDSGKTRSNTLTGTGELIGTAGYMSPEQVRGMPVDGRSDIYSYACIIFEAFTGQQALQDVSLPDLLLKQLNEPLPQILDLNSECGLPAALDKLLQYCSKKNPEERPADFKEVLELLKEIRIASPEMKFVPAKITGAARRKRAARIKWLVGLGTFVLAVALAVYAYNSLSTPVQVMQISTGAASALLKAGRAGDAAKLALQQVEGKQFSSWSAMQKCDLLFKFFRVFRDSGEQSLAQEFLARFLKVALPAHAGARGKQDPDWQKQLEEVCSYLFSHEIPRTVWKDIAPALLQSEHDGRRLWFAGHPALMVTELIEESQLRSWEQAPPDLVNTYIKRYTLAALDSIAINNQIMYKRFIERALMQCRKHKLVALEAHVRAVMCEYQLSKGNLDSARKEMLACEKLLAEVQRNPDLDNLKFSSRKRIMQTQYELYRRLLAGAESAKDLKESENLRKKIESIRREDKDLKSDEEEDRQIRDEFFDQTFKR